jgi:cytosine/adenosine deaminase-related metal-dependent hydrolase
VAVGLGTDTSDFGVADTTRAMYLVAGLYKDARESTSMIHAESALEMATIQGARALGLEHEIGSLEVGKKADIVLFDSRRSEWRPLLNPVNNLVYNADGRSVHTVIVDGEVRIEDGKPVFLDENVLLDRVQAGAERLLSRTHYAVPSRWPIVNH